MSWCLTGGRRNLGDPVPGGGEPRPSPCNELALELFELPPRPLPKQQSSERKSPRPLGFLPLDEVLLAASLSRGNWAIVRQKEDSYHVLIDVMQIL